jgi:hypothetical protein
VGDVDVVSFQLSDFPFISLRVIVAGIVNTCAGYFKLSSTSWTIGSATCIVPFKILSATGPVPLNGMVPRMSFVKGVPLA